jgi:hypothetical protein
MDRRSHLPAAERTTVCHRREPAATRTGDEEGGGDVRQGVGDPLAAVDAHQHGLPPFAADVDFLFYAVALRRHIVDILALDTLMGWHAPHPPS